MAELHFTLLAREGYHDKPHIFKRRGVWDVSWGYPHKETAARVNIWNMFAARYANERNLKLVEDALK